MKKYIRSSRTPVGELRHEIAECIEHAKKLLSDASTNEQAGALKQVIYYLNQAEDSI